MLLPVPMKNCDPAVPAGSLPALAQATDPTAYGPGGASDWMEYPGPPDCVLFGLPVWITKFFAARLISRPS